MYVHAYKILMEFNKEVEQLRTVLAGQSCYDEQIESMKFVLYPPCICLRVVKKE
jgi:hypothetical protein